MWFLEKAPSVVFIIITILGSLGYIEDIFGLKWSKKVSVILLFVFVLFSISDKVLDWYEDKHAAEKFYNQEMTQIFRPDACPAHMRFFTDASGNKSVALLLPYEP